MDAYVVLNSISSTQLVLDAWLIPEGVFTQFSDMFGFLRAAIEVLTTVFQIDISPISISNPILPKEFEPGSTFYKWFAEYETTTEKFFLYHWEQMIITLPIDAVPGMETYPYHTRWYYKDTPPDPEQGYLLPYEQQDFDAGDGQTYKASAFNGFGYAMNLMRWFTYTSPSEYVYIFYLPSMIFHYEGGTPDLSDFDFVLGPEPETHHYLASTIPPTEASYTGGNVWNISQEFSDNIDISEGPISGGWYYYLDLDNCTGKNWKTALQGAQPATEPGGVPTTQLLPLLTLLATAAEILSPFLCAKTFAQKAFTLRPNRLYGMAANNYPLAISGKAEVIKQ